MAVVALVLFATAGCRSRGLPGFDPRIDLGSPADGSLDVPEDGGATVADLALAGPPQVSSWELRSAAFATFGWTVAIGDPNTLYADDGFDTTLVSHDGGLTFVPFARPSRGPIIADPTSTMTLWALGTSLQRTTNGGGSWAAFNVGGIPSQLLFGDANASTLYVAGYDSSMNQPVFSISRDGGQSWGSSSGPLMSGDQWPTIAIDHAFTTLWMIGRDASGTDYLAKSVDGARTWARNPTNLPSGIVLVQMVIDPFDAATFYATVAGAQTGLWVSHDGAASWTQLSTFNAMVTPNPSLPGHLLATNRFAADGVWSSTDGGATWSHSLALSDRATSILFAPSNPSIVYATTTANELYRSLAGGE